MNTPITFPCLLSPKPIMPHDMQNLKDTLFANEGPVKPFEFNSEVAQVFDEMAVRSIPFYHETQERIFAILQRLPQAPQKICDLGTSTGSLVFFLAQQFDNPNLKIFGYDNSSAMIEQAKSRSMLLHLNGQIEFHLANILETDFANSDVIVLNYVLQFVAPETRLALVKKLYRDLKPGGVLILSEKTKPAQPQLAEIFSDCHDAYRMKNHYSQLEIAQKRKALENVLVPWSLATNLKVLADAGFADAEPFLIWHNFASIVAIKC